MAHKRKRGVYAGWFAEIPVSLKQEFDLLYPGRRSKRLLTIAFVSWAIRMKPDLEALAVKYPEVKDETKPKTEEKEDVKASENH